MISLQEASRDVNPLLSRMQVSRWLQVSCRTIARFQSQGMPAVKVGGLWRYDPAAIATWLRYNP
jgi:phage terminase Nu1 subunit (DNA packaging protein)